jgi:hypothetical protein
MARAENSTILVGQSRTNKKEPIALGRKVSDEFTVPLCRGHHRELHRHGDESVWWEKTGIDPISAARALWLKTRPLGALWIGDERTSQETKTAEDRASHDVASAD